MPGHERHRGRRPRTRDDPRRRGADVAAILDRHFSDPDAQPSLLADAFHDVDVPIHVNEHIAAAALRADRHRVRRTGRWLVRHSTDRCAALVGLALLATDWADDDIPLIQTIGLLSNTFGALAAKALRRRRDGQALLWLAQRVGGWGRVYVVEELCGHGSAAAVRGWLLRHACDGDFLNGYFAGKVAVAGHLHDAITGAEVDDALVDHTGRLLRVMSDCHGMGTTLEHYPPAPTVLAAHADHLGRQTPTATRYVDAALIVHHLTDKVPERCGCTTGQRDEIVRRYRAVLDHPDWCDVARPLRDRGDDFATWFAGTVAARLRLRAFSGDQ